MAPIQEGAIVLFSGYSSSLEISFVSIIFLILFIILLSVCIMCHRTSPDPSDSADVQKNQSALTDKVVFAAGDQTSSTDLTNGNHAISPLYENWTSEAANRPFHPQKSHTVVYNHHTRPHSHFRGGSHGYFNQGEQLEIPIASLATASFSNLSHFRDLPLPPKDCVGSVKELDSSLRVRVPSETGPSLFWDTEHQLDCNNIISDHIYSLAVPDILKENPYECTYECIDKERVNVPPPSVFLEDTTEDQQEQLYQTVKKPKKAPVNQPVTLLDESCTFPTEKSITLAPPPSADVLTNEHLSAIYAVVNKKNKSACKKEELSIEPSLCVADGGQDSEDGDAVIPPPVPFRT